MSKREFIVSIVAIKLQHYLLTFCHTKTSKSFLKTVLNKSFKLGYTHRHYSHFSEANHMNKL